MRILRNWISGTLASAELASVAIMLPCLAHAQTERVLYKFTAGADGGNPEGGLVADASGNLYGTTPWDGSAGCGTAFELKRTKTGYSFGVIWAFQLLSASDGCSPICNLALDGAGNLYGTTFGGGAYASVENSGGTVFELSPNGSGRWNEEVLWSFSGGQDGYLPLAGLTFDAAGNLYGTTQGGGCSADGVGTVFELSPNSDGSWSETVLHTFGCIAGDGSGPVANVTLDSAGNIYGTTLQGGSGPTPCGGGCGTVFELEKASAWKEIQLYVFTGYSDGASPKGAVVLDKAEHVYGTTWAGGDGDDQNGHGVVFELSKTKAGWKENVVHTFVGNADDGAYPDAGLIASGNRYYGTTSSGGSSGAGTDFELTHTASGWAETVLHSFGLSSDGNSPQAPVIIDKAGRLYGATAGGGDGSGTVFEASP